MGQVKALILRAPGTNCDVETAFAFQQAGAETLLVHINQLVNRERRLADYQIMVIPGGFTYGDDLGAGKILANELKLNLGEDILSFIENGGLILGICNGFQVLVKTGILPEPSQFRGPLRVTLTANDSGKFECRWVHLRANPQSPCVFTKGVESMYLPIAHGEGKFIAYSDLSKPNEALYYADENGDVSAGYPHNPNGSVRNIAGICDTSGRIFALMPHPERHIRGTQHPRWTRRGAQKYGDGFQIFLNAVKWVKGS